MLATLMDNRGLTSLTLMVFPFDCTSEGFTMGKNVTLEGYLQVNPFALQLAQQGFCSSPSRIDGVRKNATGERLGIGRLHFLLRLRQVQQPVRTRCFSAWVVPLVGIVICIYSPTTQLGLFGRLFEQQSLVGKIG